MLLTQGKAKAYLEAFSRGELTAQEAPEWMSPLIWLSGCNMFPTR